MISFRAVVRRLLGAVIILGVAQAACRTGVCPTIGCQPEVSLTYRQPVAATYHVAVSLRGVTFEADCPMERPYPTVGLESCSADGIVLTGVDLGHGSNETADLTVTLEGGETLAVTAMLDGIANSRDCELVCYRHTGTIPN